MRQRKPQKPWQERNTAKWTHQRIPRETHELIAQIAAQFDMQMQELIHVAVQEFAAAQHLRRLFTMARMTYFIVYIDEKPTYLVAGIDKEKAELGVRKLLFNEGQAFKTLDAKGAFDAPFEDFARVTLLALNKQMTDLNAILASAYAAATTQGGLPGKRR